MPLQSCSRRRFLTASALATTVAVAGCLDVRGESSSGRELELSLSRAGETLRDQFVTDLSATRLDRDEKAFEAALEGEAYTTQHRKPFHSTPEDPTYTRHDGTYYHLGSVVVDEVTTTRPVLRLSSVGEPGDASTPESVDADELPTGDRRAVHVAHLAARARGNEGGVPWGLVQRGGYVYRSEEAVQTSALLSEDGPAHVTYRDRVYAIEVARERFHEPVYRASVEPVAESPERMEAVLRAQFVDARVTRDDLSTAAREIIEAARNEGYAETHPYSEGYREVLEALRGRAYLDGDVRRDADVETARRRVLLYGETYYDYRLRFVSNGGS